jgi:hypothetical protein
VVSQAPVAIISPFDRNYWERFGERFVSSIERLTVQPQEVVLVTNADVKVPGWWRVINYWDSRIWPCANIAVREVESEWATHLPVDDTMDADFFQGLVLDGDAVNVAGRWNGGLCYGTSDQYSRLLDLGHNGMPGLAIIRTEVWRKIPYRSHKYVDWIHWCELRANGYRATFDTAVRWTWHRHDDALTAADDQQAVNDVIIFANLLREGRVIPGEEWPPRLKSLAT